MRSSPLLNYGKVHPENQNALRRMYQCTCLIFTGPQCGQKAGKRMRLDKYLKVSRLIKRRTVANEACDAGRVLINDKVAKASTEVKVGDIIEIGFGTKAVKVEVLDIQDTTKKDAAKELFKYL